MRPDLVSQMPPLEFSKAELDQPVSMSDGGGVATVRHLIAEKGSDTIRQMFDIWDRVTVHVRPVSQLDRNALKEVAIALLKSSDPRKRVTSIGGGDYTPSELMSEVERETSMGRKIIRGVRLNGILVETAVASGKIKPRSYNLGS